MRHLRHAPGTGLLLLVAACADPAATGAPAGAPGGERELVLADGAAYALRVGREEVAIRTAAIERGGASVRDAAVEAFTPAGEGVEQTWRFDHAPEGGGDLVVRVGLGDLTFVGTAPCGARFRREETGAGLCYGRATWVDAAGARTPVRWSIDARSVAMRVPGELLDGSAYPAVLDPIITPEVDVGDFAWGPTIDEEWYVDAASDGDGALAVWFAEPAWEVEAQGTIEVLGRRIGADGRPEGAPIVFVEDASYDVHVAFDGIAHRVLALAAGGPYTMFRVTPDGVVLDPGGIEVAGLDFIVDLACAPDGSCLVVGEEATRIDPEGNVLDVIELPGGEPYERRVVRVAGGYHILWAGDGGAAAVTALDDGSSELRGWVPIEAWGGEEEPLIAVRVDGTTLVKTCGDGTSWMVLDEALDRVVPDGEHPLQCGRGLLPTDAGFATVMPPAEGPGGSWALAEIDVESGVLRSTALTTPVEAFNLVGVRTAEDRGTWLWPWPVSADLPMGTQLELTALPFRLDTLAVEERELLTVGPAVQIHPRAAAGPAGRAVLFTDHRRLGEPRARLRLFASDGAPSPGPSVEVASARTVHGANASAFAGDEVIVAWTESTLAATRTLVRRYGFDGAPLDAAPSVVRDGDVMDVVLAASEQGFVVGTSNGSEGSVLRGFSTTGSLVPGTPIEVPHAVAAADRRGDELWVIHGAYLSRFALDGTLLAAAIEREVTGDLMACGEGRCLTAELSPSDAEVPFVLHELLPDGSAIGPLFSGGVDAIGLAWDGVSFVAVRHGPWLQEPQEHPTTWHAPGGAVVDEGAWLATRWARPGPLAVAGLGEGSSWAVYEDAADFRLRARTLTNQQEMPTTTAAGAGGAGGGPGGAGGANAASASTASADGGGAGGTGGDAGTGAGGTGGASAGVSGGSGGEPGTSAGGRGGAAATATSGAGDGGGGAGADGGARDGASDDGGCSCDVPAGDGGSPLVAVAGLGLLALRRRRRAAA